MSLPSPKVSRSGLDAVRFAAAVVAVLGLATQAAAAPPTAFGVEAATTSAADDLAEGHRLERARDWSAAIEHYDAALERHPDDSKLSYGLRRSKIHFGIDRRYADGSFDRDMLGMSPRTAYALFDDIFRQVRDRYVEDVRATAFVAHGTESLYLALANEKFVRGNLAHVDYARVQRLRDRLRARYWNRPVGTASARETVREVARLARSTAGLSETAVVMEYIFGGCNALDDYSNYLTPDRLDDLHGNIAGEFVGLGIEMKAENGQGMFLVDVLPGSPAEEGGLHAGEHIVTIDGVDCRSLSTDDAARLLRGPSGSTVTLRVADGTTERTWQGRFVRRAVQVKSVAAAKIIDPARGVGYIRMTGFQETTAEEMDEALESLRRQGMRSLVWDLRGNPGGLLTAAVEVLDRFIDDGVLVSTRGRTHDQNWTYSAHGPGTWRDLELALLVDQNSASASEIVAGAIRDHERGVIVGDRTYGKWSVQSILPVRGRTGLRLTTAKFYSPDGLTHGKVGLVPDLEVDSEALAGGPGTTSRTTAYRGRAGGIPDADPVIRAATNALRGGLYAKN